MIITKNIIGNLLIEPVNILKIKNPEFDNNNYKKIFEAINRLVKKDSGEVGIIEIKDFLISTGQLDQMGGVSCLMEIMDSANKILPVKEQPMKTSTLLKIAELIAEDSYKGHLTILRFTTHWKVFFGTPDMDTGKGREFVNKIYAFDSLDEALSNLIQYHFEGEE